MSAAQDPNTVVEASIANQNNSKRKKAIDQRQAITRACSACQRKKTRCTGTQPCPSCQKTNTECIYTIGMRRGPRKKNDKPSSPSSEKSESLHTSFSPALQWPSNLPFPSPNNLSLNGQHSSTNGFPHFLPISETHRDLMRILPTTLASSSSMTVSSSAERPLPSNDTMTSNDPMDEGADEDAANSISFVDQLYTTLGPQLKEYSQLLPQDLLVPDDAEGESELEAAPILHGSPLSAGRTPLSQSTQLPDDPELMALADNPKIQTLLYNIYFCFVHPTYPMLYRPTFDPKECAAATPHLHFSILALCCRFDFKDQISQVSHPFVEQLSGSKAVNNRALSDFFFEKAKQLLFSRNLQSDISSIQTLVNCTLREIAQGRRNTAYMYSGMAVRMALELNMHESQELRNKDATLAQERSRTMWICYCLDRYISLILGRPAMLRFDDVLTPYPSTWESDEFAIWQSDAKLIIPEASVRYKGLRTRCISTLIAWAKLCGIIERIREQIYKRKKPLDECAANVEQLNGDLEIWLSETSVQLAWSQDRDYMSQLPHSLSLQLWYHTTCLILHRPFIPTHRTFLRNGVQKSSYQISSVSAHTINQIVTVLESVLGLYRLPHSIVFIMFQAGIMHLASSTSSEAQTSQAGSAAFKQCLRWLDTVGATYRLSPRYCQVLSALEKLGQRQGSIPDRSQLLEILQSRRGSRANSPAQPDVFANIDTLLATPQADVHSNPFDLNAYLNSTDGTSPLNSLQLHSDFFNDMPLSMPFTKDDMSTWQDFVVQSEWTRMQLLGLSPQPPMPTL